VPQIRGQVSQAGSDVNTVLVPTRQACYGKTVTKRMEGGPAAAVSFGKAEMEKQPLKAAAQGFVPEALAVVFDKEGDIAWNDIGALPGVSR
jgi:hypothetical protein